MVPFLLLLGLVGAAVLASSVKQINEWEVGLKFTLGRLSGRLEPGIRMVLPVVQRFARIDKRIRNRDLPRQVVITRDNVTALIDAVVYFKVVDPQKAVLNVENYELAVKDRAKVVLRDVVGEITLDELLANRDEVAARVRAQVEQFVSQWGLHLELIALQDIQLPSNISDAIARKAIAERDKQVVIIKSQADLESAKNFAEAARVLTAQPGALELRRLEALQGISGSGNTKIVFDLAKPSGGDDRAQAAALAAAMAEDARPAADVRVADEEPGLAEDEPGLAARIRRKA
ncbi:SPFH domain-containing protein [Sandaracinus amylolyticus]|uniref:SPFH domain-containing protein n=1 Tax=Sandaracinus amylolyticus TaxID=927083 RepID=UPI001EFF0C85|nr:SPFH domain-containing protein [Sandaracinus amylolyticus]UJR81915.1 PHB domain-containing protein [Sandaracinus amylolyticus]